MRHAIHHIWRGVLHASIGPVIVRPPVPNDLEGFECSAFQWNQLHEAKYQVLGMFVYIALLAAWGLSGFWVVDLFTDTAWRIGACMVFGWVPAIILIARRIRTGSFS